MTRVLRFAGILNAAVWCGSSIFMMAALPALFSPELKKILTTPGVGFAAETMVARYFIVQYCCGIIALAHLAMEWSYFGRSWRRLEAVLAVGVLAVTALGGLWLQPRMRHWHIVKYYGRTAAEQAQAARSFAAWHGVSETANLLIMLCLIMFLWRMGSEPESPKFVNFGKMRG